MPSDLTHDTTIGADSLNTSSKQAAWLCLLFGLAALHWCGQTPAAASEELNSVPRYTIEQFLGVSHLSGASVSADGTRILLSSDEDGISNAYAVRITDGEAKQLTRSSKESVEIVSYFPYDDRFLYLSDRGGNELNHLYVQETDGRSVDLTPGQDHKARFLGWAQDGGSFFLSTNERDHRYFDIYEIEVDGYRRSLLYKDENGYEFGEISPDKRYISFGRMHTRSDIDALLYDLNSGSMSELYPQPGEVASQLQAFSRDGEAGFYTTDHGREFAYLVREDLKTGERQVVVQEEWDVSFAKLSHAGKYLAVGVNVDGRTAVRLFDGRTLERLSEEIMPRANLSSVEFSRDETKMIFYANTSRTPPDLYVYEFDGQPPRRLTHARNSEIDERDLVEARSVRFLSFDGLEIPGLLYLPKTASPNNRVPAVVWVHGGPGGQSRVEYKPLIQYLVNQGYAVFAVNNRGSSGYGKSFFRADDRRHGKADLDDLIASKQALVQTAMVSPERIGIIGTSYGGFLVLAAMSFRPDEFAAGVELFGISNWIRTLEMMPPWWQYIRGALYHEIGDPRQDRDFLKGISPLFHADKIVRPLMVLQGRNDPRVIKSESDDIVRAARANGTPVEYLVFDDEGHGLRKKENKGRAFRAIHRFLDRHVKHAKVQGSDGSDVEQ